MSQFEQSNETSLGIKISLDDLTDVEWLDVVVQTNYISPETILELLVLMVIPVDLPCCDWGG